MIEQSGYEPAKGDSTNKVWGYHFDIKETCDNIYSLRWCGCLATKMGIKRDRMGSHQQRVSSGNLTSQTIEHSILMPQNRVSAEFGRSLTRCIVSIL